jgi:hypothetical protein
MLLDRKLAPTSTYNHHLVPTITTCVIENSIEDETVPPLSTDLVADSYWHLRERLPPVPPAGKQPALRHEFFRSIKIEGK